MTVGPEAVSGAEEVPGAELALGAGVVPGLGPVALPGPGVGVALTGAPGAESDGGAGGVWLAGIRRILAAMGTSPSSSSSPLSPSCERSRGGDGGGDGGGGVLNTPSGSKSARFRN